jgi:hypothetical protein
MKVLLDTNVLLNLLLNRAPWVADVTTIWTALRAPGPATATLLCWFASARVSG